MRLTHLATNRIIITRMVAISGYKKALTTVTAAVANIQPIAPDKIALMGGVLGKTFKIFVDTDVDIQEHDKLRDVDTGSIYKVKAGGVSRHAYIGMEYYEVLVEQLN